MNTFNFGFRGKMRFLFPYIVCIASLYAYGMEEDENTERVNDGREIRRTVMALRTDDLDRFEGMWKKFALKREEMSRQQKKEKCSQLAQWGIRNLLPLELITEIAHLRLLKDLKQASCQLYPNNRIGKMGRKIFQPRKIRLSRKDGVSCYWLSENSLEMGGWNFTKEFYKPPQVMRSRTGAMALNNNTIRPNTGLKTELIYRLRFKTDLDELIKFDGCLGMMLFVCSKKKENDIGYESNVCMCLIGNDERPYHMTQPLPEITACALTNAVTKKNNFIAFSSFEESIHRSRVHVCRYDMAQSWQWSDHRERGIKEKFKKISFITTNMLLGLTDEGKLIVMDLRDDEEKAAQTQAAEEEEEEEDTYFFEQKFFRSAQSKGELLKIEDVAVDSYHPYQFIMLGIWPDSKDKQVFYVNLTDARLRFCCIELNANNIKRIFFNEGRIGYLTQNAQGKEQFGAQDFSMPFNKSEDLFRLYRDLWPTSGEAAMDEPESEEQEITDEHSEVHYSKDGRKRKLMSAIKNAPSHIVGIIKKKIQRKNKK